MAQRRLFTFGVGSGDPTATSVVLWTHLDPTVGSPCAWHLRDATGSTRSGIASTDDGIVRVEIGSLEPATSYRYWFTADGVRSGVGTTRTLPVGPSAMRIAVVCCARLPSGPFAAYRQVAEAAPDLVVHVGDYIYGDGDGGSHGTHDPPHECRTAADYERRYRQYRSDPHLQTLHAAAPWVALWDDHEFADDAWRWGARAETGSPVRWLQRRHAAAEVYHRWMPQRPHGNGPTPADRVLHLGSTAELVIVDARMAGRDRPVGDADGPQPAPADEGERQLLTDAQWTWLHRTVTDTTARHLLIVSSVQVAPLRLASLPRRGWPPWRWLVNPDQWDGYPSERRRLMDLLARHDRSDATVLSGDLHGRFHITPGAGRLREITTPSVSAPSFAEAVRTATVAVPTRLLERWLQLLNPHIETLDLATHGATILDIDDRNIVATAIEARNP